MVFKPITWIRSFGKNLTNIFFIWFYIKVINLERRKYETSAQYNATETGIRKTHFQHPSKCCRLQLDDEQNKTGQWLSDLSINNLYPEEEDMGL